MNFAKPLAAEVHRRDRLPLTLIRATAALMLAALGACATSTPSDAPMAVREAQGVVTLANDRGALAMDTVKGTFTKIPSLKTLYAKKFAVGVAIDDNCFKPAERALILAQFSTVTPCNSLKMDATQPKEGHFTFEKADALVEMAQSAGLTVNGHTLVWHEQCPDWFFTDHDQPAGKELVLERMRTHITQVAGHFAGKIASWDVVNEALADGKDGYLRQTKWLDIAGPDFIAEAFKAAHKADPHAKLYYNDYNLEDPDKRKKLLRMIRDLKARHVQIDGISTQGHWCLNSIPFKDIEDTIKAIHAEGLAVAVSELDIDLFPNHSFGEKEGAPRDPYAAGLPPEVGHQLAQQYGQLFALLGKYPGVVSRVTFWGLDDGHSWLNTWPKMRVNHPLLWDRQLQPKEAFWEVVKQAEEK